MEVGVEKLEGSRTGAGVERDGLEATGRLKSALPSEALPSTARSPKLKKGFSKERVEAVLKSGGKLSRADLLRCRVRWFSDGVAIGSKGFVEWVFQGCRSYFGAKRKNGARKSREDAAGSLHALRELRVNSLT